MDIVFPISLVHPHALELKSYKGYYRCHGCKYSGFGLRFRCEPCNFDLHEECARVKQTTTHDLYRNNIFNFFPEPHDHHSILCDGCGRLVNGYVYYCEELKSSLHPCCYSLPSKFKFYHLEFMLRHRMSSMCLLCNRESWSWLKGSTRSDFPPPKGWSYVSKCNKYNFHVRCATRKYFKNGVPLGNSSEQSIQGFLELYFGGSLKRQRRRKIVMSFVITNLALELVSALLDQVSSSVNKTQFALFGMLISFVAMLTCIVELIYEVRTKKLIWRWSSILPFPWYYYQDQAQKPFGTFKDIVGLICALCQCVVAAVCYCYLQRHADNPVKISIFPIIFAFGILFSQILKNQDVERSSRENEIHSV